MAAYTGYVNLKYRPKPTDLVCDFYVEPAKGITVRDAGERVASESSIGTWIDIPHTKKHLAAQVFAIKGNNIRIAYHHELFEDGNVPQVLSSIAGNIFGMKELNNLRLNDIIVPEKYAKSFKGPAFGVEGIRRVTKITRRPLLGTIVKPKLGLTAFEHSRIAYQAWKGGCDIVKDDENLTNQTFNRFKERVSETLGLRDKVEREVGARKLYMPNVTAETNEMINRAKYVKATGGEYVMVDVFTCGFSAVQTLRESDLGVIIHGHRAGHAAITRNHKHGMSMAAFCRLLRLAGVDQLHVGTGVGKMIETTGEVKRNVHAAQGKWHGVKTMMCVNSGGLNPTEIPELVKLYGKDIVIQLGGGIHGHPGGTTAGAKAARQALDATMGKKSLKDHAKKHPELAIALKMWGKKS
ncbi:MAG: type III ribulose-bisphosphate carboxylase [Candidatus Aenigmatarchaeota archaeon]